MRREWFENPDNIVYADTNEFADNFGKETGISDLRKRIEDFKGNPGNGEITIIGKKRTAIKLLVPDMIFDRHIEMGENVWLYVGETYPAYCLY